MNRPLKRLAVRLLSREASGQVSTNRDGVLSERSKQMSQIEKYIANFRKIP